MSFVCEWLLSLQDRRYFFAHLTRRRGEPEGEASPKARRARSASCARGKGREKITPARLPLLKPFRRRTQL